MGPAVSCIVPTTHSRPSVCPGVRAGSTQPHPSRPLLAPPGPYGPLIALFRPFRLQAILVGQARARRTSGGVEIRAPDGGCSSADSQSPRVQRGRCRCPQFGTHRGSVCLAPPFSGTRRPVTHPGTLGECIPAGGCHRQRHWPWARLVIAAIPTVSIYICTGMKAGYGSDSSLPLPLRRDFDGSERCRASSASIRTLERP